MVSFKKVKCNFQITLKMLTVTKLIALFYQLLVNVVPVNQNIIVKILESFKPDDIYSSLIIAPSPAV